MQRRAPVGCDQAGARAALAPGPSKITLARRTQKPQVDMIARSAKPRARPGGHDLRYILCALGWIFALAALAAAGWAAALGGPADILTRPLGELWFRLHPGSLNLSQAVIERYICPPLWDPAISSVLLSPAALVFAVLAMAFLLACSFRRLRARFAPTRSR
jgi:hypothetical protein